MGKSVRGKNSNPPKTKEEDVPSVPEENQVTESIEERLRRIEMSHSGGSSDVYKFAFFFIMGVVLTVIIYPGVSSTIESMKLGKDAKSLTFRETKQEVLDKVNTVSGDTEVERTLEKTSDGAKQEKQENATRMSSDKSYKEDLMIDEASDNDKEDSKYMDIDMDEQIVSSDVNRQEDALIGETPDVINKQHREPLKLTPVSQDSEKVSLVLEPETLQLFPESGKDTQQESDVAKESKRKKTNVKKPAKQTPKDVQATKKNVKLNKKKDTPGEEDNAQNKNIPDVIKNFKPTFLKGTKPKKIFADGRRIPPMELLPQKPNNSSVKVWMFEEFLSEQECDGLMRVHNQHVQDQSKDDPILCFDSISTLRKHIANADKQVHVTPRDFTAGTTCVNSSFSSQLKDWFKGNWSYSTAFYPGESRFANIFANRVQEAMGLSPENGGKFQITSYPTGIGYKSHTDCMEDSDDQRDRVATVLVYLDTVTEGGETDFPELGIWARPKKGRALMWNNMDENGHCEPLSIHQAKQVVTGHKYILQRWYYYKSFYSLGKRPPEPHLPARNSGQPRVSCDEYAHGSCRWYDEWNFEHMIEYEKQKYTLI